MILQKRREKSKKKPGSPLLSLKIGEMNLS